MLLAVWPPVPNHASVKRSSLTAIPKDDFLNFTSTAGGGWERLRIISMWLLWFTRVVIHLVILDLSALKLRVPTSVSTKVTSLLCIMSRP